MTSKFLRSLTFFVAVLACGYGALIPRGGAQTLKTPEVIATVTERSAGRYHCVWKISNHGPTDIYIADSARRANGSVGPLVDLDVTAAGGTLVVSYRLFPVSPKMLLFKNESSVHLILLRAGASYTEEADIDLPTRETLPPYGSELRRKTITEASISTVVLAVGIFPSSETVKGILASRDSGWVNGLETHATPPTNEAPLVDLQSIISSGPVSKPK